MHIGRFRTSSVDLDGRRAIGSENVQPGRQSLAIMETRSRGRRSRLGRGLQSYDVGLADMFTSEGVARFPIRRQVLHRCAQYQDLLPSNLPCAHSERRKRPLLSNGRRGGGIRVPSLSALPAGMFAGNPGLVRNFKYGFASSAPDRGEWPGRRRNGRPR